MKVNPWAQEEQVILASYKALDMFTVTQFIFFSQYND